MREAKKVIERNEKMNDLQPGDQIDIVFDDAQGPSTRATVRRLLSDEQEGLSPEAEDYCIDWLEISLDNHDPSAQTQTIVLGADWKYYMDEREVKICKCVGSPP
jgi:hypothetical protein